jgi:hypothetical protein
MCTANGVKVLKGNTEKVLQSLKYSYRKFKQTKMKFDAEVNSDRLNIARKHSEIKDSNKLAIYIYL